MAWFYTLPWGEILEAVSPSPTHPASSFINMLIVRLFARVRFKHLLWWQKGKLLGVASLPLTLSLHPALVGPIVHLLLDFTLQSSSTAANKSKHGWALFVHAVVVGGWSGGAVGLLAAGLPGLLQGIFVGVALHWAIDRMDKFHITDWRWAISIDQALHLLSLALIWAIV